MGAFALIGRISYSLLSNVAILLFIAGLFAFRAFPAETPILVVNSGGHEAPVRALAFSRDGKLLYSAGDDKVVRVWDLETGAIVRTIRGQIHEGNAGKIYTLALSADNRLLAVAGFMKYSQGSAQGMYIRVHDLSNRAEIFRVLLGPTDAITQVAFSPNGRYLASASGDGIVRIHDLTSEAMGPAKELRGHQGRVYSVAFSPDGKRIVSAGADHSVRIWDVSTGTPTVLTGHQDRVVSAVFSPKGNYIASAAEDRQIRLWDAGNRSFIKTLATQGVFAANLSFSADGRRLLAGSTSPDGAQTVAQIYSVPEGQPVPQARFSSHKQPITAAALSPDGRKAATAGGLRNEIYLWDSASGQLQPHAPLIGRGQPVLKVGFAENGESVAYGNQANRQLDKVFYLRHGAAYRPGFGGDLARVGGSYTSEIVHTKDIELKPAGPAEDQSQSLQIIRGGKSLSPIKRTDSTGYRHSAYTLTPDGQYLITGGLGGYMSLFRTSDGQFVREFRGHTGDITSIAPSGRNEQTFVSGSADQTIRIWDINQEFPLLNIFIAEDDQWVAWIPAGYYTTNGQGDAYMGWHINRGPAKTALWFGAAQYMSEFYKPEVVVNFLGKRNIMAATQVSRDVKAVSPTTVAEKMPPLVVIKYPPSQTETVVKEAKVRVTAAALSETSPITSFKILVDGVVAVERKLPRAEKTANISEEIRLKPEQASRIEAVFSNGKEGRDYCTIRASEVKDVPPQPESNLYVLAIGLAKYMDTDLKLQFADADARDVVAALKTQENGPFGKVNFYPRDADPAAYPGRGSEAGLFNEQATKKNILYGLGWLRDAGTPYDVRVIFISGHGGISNDRYFFWCYPYNKADKTPEAENVTDRDIMDMIMQMRGRVILMVDTCHSSAILGAGVRGSTPDDSITPFFKREEIAGTKVYTYASSGRTEKSLEHLKWGHGAFTLALLEAFEGKIPDTKRVLNTSIVGEYLSARVRKLTENQQNARPILVPPAAEPFNFFYVKKPTPSQAGRQ